MSAPPPLQLGQSASTPGSDSVSPGREPSRSRARRHSVGPAFTTRSTNTPTGTRRPTTPRLRLTQAAPVTVRNAPRPTPLQGSADPRWVLAVRTAELLQGDILPPDDRERIVRMAGLFDLTPFDANMIIAIVQDQARRGIAPRLCPAAGEPQLRMITPPRRKTLLQMIKSRHGMKVVVLLGALLAIEGALILWAL
jgi:hypothetical protein